MSNRIAVSFHVENPLWKSRLRPYTKIVQEVLEVALLETKLNIKLRLSPAQAALRPTKGGRLISSQPKVGGGASPLFARPKNSKSNFEIAVVLADDKFVQALNRQYRGKNKPTNVLSFPSDEEGELGDLILAIETIEKEAQEQKKKFRNHAIHLLVHGFLHLLGYDHLEKKQAEIMECLEVKILKRLGVSNPYILTLP